MNMSAMIEGLCKGNMRISLIYYAYASSSEINSNPFLMNSVQKLTISSARVTSSVVYLDGSLRGSPNTNSSSSPCLLPDQLGHKSVEER